MPPIRIVDTAVEMGKGIAMICICHAGRTYEHAGQLIPDLQAIKGQRLDISHSITSLSFGDKGYPGQVTPLAGATFDQRKKTSSNPSGRPGKYCAPLVVDFILRP